ncbi:subtilisin-like protein [Lactarius quietus]|nr:subtilisin-like protein [Lactarius quietus]
MRYFQLSMLCILTAAPLHNIAAKPLPPHWDHLRVKHSWNNVPPNWESLGHPPAGTTIDLNIVLMPYNESALIDALYEVSDPKSVKYGSHLSKEQVNRLIAPHPDTLDLVHSWLGYHDIPSSSVSMTRGGSLLTLTGVPISRANDLLGASYQLYRHEGTNDTAIIRTIGYSLPTVLHAHVQTVMPTTYFSTRTSWQVPLKHYVNSTANMESREVVRMPSIRDNNNYVVTPASLRELYRMSAYVPAASDRNVLAITAFLNRCPSVTDFAEFMARYRSDAVNPLEAFYHVEVNGGVFDQSNPNPEGNSNTQYTGALVSPTPILVYNIGGDVQTLPGNNEPAVGDFFLEWLLVVLDQENVPQTITISFGLFEKYLPMEYGTTICNIFAELGSRGASVLVASGNSGIGPEDCKDIFERIQFHVQFPSSCPWVTSVGGTMNQESRAEDDAVKTFQETDPTQYYNGYYNRYGRAIPDISAQAINYYVIYKSQPFRAFGTACATSTAASIISLLNDYRISKGRKPLGFLNPWLYGHGRKGFYDVISGSNKGCGTKGFPAIAGWDPVRPAWLTSPPIPCSLILGSVGDGSRDAGLFTPAVHT